MKSAVLAAVLLGAAAVSLSAQPVNPSQPKLIVAITIDQFRYDYLYRFSDKYNAGLKRLLQQGAVFTNAHYEHFPTVTAIGHATFLSGAYPALSGIVGNEWYDRELGKTVTSVSDDGTKLLGVASAERRGSSPRRLLVSTLCDELKMSNNNATRAIGVSIKDRSAILPVGRMANGAYWFDPVSGNFVSSSYYFAQLPEWAVKFNAGRSVDRWAGQAWNALDAKPGDKPLRTLPAKLDKEYFDGLERTPWGNDIVLEFALAALEGEKLGRRGVTDVLSVSFSSNDRIGHSMGPDSPHVRDVSIHTDRQIGRLLDHLDDALGRGNYVAVLTADHGVAPTEEEMKKRNMMGGRVPPSSVEKAVTAALVARYGEGDWVVGKSGPAPYLNHKLILEKNLKIEEVEETAAAAARRVPHVARVYTRTQLMLGRINDDPVDRRIRNGFNQQRASDLFVVSEPYYLFESSGTGHGTPYSYDSHVPVIFYGPGFKPGRYHRRAAVNDIAPTLATYLNVETPAGALGRVLDEMF